MAYSSGYLNKRAMIYRAVDPIAPYSVPEEWVYTFSLWCHVAFQKGSAILKQGDLMLAETLVISCRTHPKLDKYVRIKYQDKMYRITSYNEDQEENEVVMTAERIEG